MRRLSRLVGSGRESTVPLLLHPTRRDREGQAGLMETALSGTSSREVRQEGPGQLWCLVVPDPRQPGSRAVPWTLKAA